MGVYIGDVWVPYVSQFDVDRGSRRVQIVRHIDSTVPPHFAEFPNPILNADISGTLIQNSTSPKTATDYAEDVLSLLDSEKAYNYIHEFQERSGWLSVSNAESPNDADTPLSREYSITGNFLPSKTYQSRFKSSPSMRDNDFSMVLGSDGVNNYIPLPKGAVYMGGDGSGYSITRITKDGEITLVLANSTTDVIYDNTSDEVDVGECKCWDTMNSGDESNWVRVYNKDHEFTDKCVFENGLIRIELSLSSTRTYFNMYCYVPSTDTWEEELQLFIEDNGTDPSPDIGISDYNIVHISSDKIIINPEQYSVGYKRFISMERGKTWTEFYTSGITGDREDRISEWGSAPDKSRFAYLPVTASPILYDGMFDTTTTTITSVNSDNYTMLLSPDHDYQLFGIAAVGNSFDQTLQASYDVTGDNGKKYGLRGRTSGDNKTMVGGIETGDMSAMFKECEDMLQGSGVTYYTGVDASPKTGNTGSTLDADAETIQYYFIAGTDLPLGTYKLFIRAKDSNQVADDLRIDVWNSTESTSILPSIEYKTLTSSWAYYSIDVTLSSEIDGDNILVHLSKETATANTIDLDYVLWVPITSPNGNFPQDIAHQAMVEQGLKRELIGRE